MRYSARFRRWMAGAPGSGFDAASASSAVSSHATRLVAAAPRPGAGGPPGASRRPAASGTPSRARARARRSCPDPPPAATGPRSASGRCGTRDNGGGRCPAAARGRAPRPGRRPAPRRVGAVARQKSAEIIPRAKEIRRPFTGFGSVAFDPMRKTRSWEPMRKTLLPGAGLALAFGVRAGARRRRSGSRPGAPGTISGPETPFIEAVQPKAAVAVAALVAVAPAPAQDTRPTPAPEAGLIEAVQRRDARAVAALVAAGADVNAARADGSTPLAWAALRDAAGIVETLLQAGADPNDCGRERRDAAALRLRQREPGDRADAAGRRRRRRHRALERRHAAAGGRATPATRRSCGCW